MKTKKKQPTIEEMTASDILQRMGVSELLERQCLAETATLARKMFIQG